MSTLLFLLIYIKGRGVLNEHWLTDTLYLVCFWILFLCLMKQNDFTVHITFNIFKSIFLFLTKDQSSDIIMKHLCMSMLLRKWISCLGVNASNAFNLTLHLAFSLTHSTSYSQLVNPVFMWAQLLLKLIKCTQFLKIDRL